MNTDDKRLGEAVSVLIWVYQVGKNENSKMTT